MSIVVDESGTGFHLQTPNSSYLIKIVCGYPAHVYYGKRVPDAAMNYLLRLDENPFTPETNSRDRASFMDSLPMEYPCFGTGDYREPALKILDNAGMSACDLQYVSHKIYAGKPQLAGLPASFAGEDEAQTLELTLRDSYTGLEAVLLYTAFTQLDVIARSVRFHNCGTAPLSLTRAYSACYDFDGCDFDMITLHGSWARERHVERCRLHHGKQGVDSMRGESSHQYNPFAALVSHNAEEDNGEAYGFSFVYSGNFTANAEYTQFDRTRFVMGINSLDFSWLLEPDEIFTAPEVLSVYSDTGLGGMSRTFHDLFRGHMIRSPWRNQSRPVLINNWEATYFDFNEEKLLNIAREASQLGIEMLVMDDGWFGHRDSDNSSLGDWFPDRKKLPNGLNGLVEKVNAMGMKFGIWFEPEMVSPDSELFRAHPDWAIQIPGRPMTLCREQFVLDYSRKDVRDHVYGMLKSILDSANIEYVKWDMNRQLTEAGSTALPANRQREIWHRYVLGVYELMERLITDYPNLILENCSGGGARFDPAMLYYSPQIWTSDDTDAIERLKIQHGTSLVYPCSAMGAHVSDCPNHAVGRTTPFSTRADCALVGTFGYELDVTKISQEDRDRIPQQIAAFKKYNALVRDGDHYRIGNVFADGNWDAWMFVTKDKSEALFEYVQVLARANHKSRRIRLKGLDPDALYFREDKPDEKYSGAALLFAGITIPPLWGDFQSIKLHFLRA